MRLFSVLKCHCEESAGRRGNPRIPIWATIVHRGLPRRCATPRNDISNRKRFWSHVLIYLFGLSVSVSATLAAPPVELSWPTPSTAFAEGRHSDTFLQHAGSGDPASGGFGGVRSNGRQYHEGLDIRPVESRRRGEATDPVFAAMDGVVRYINPISGKSSYGRYIVIEHPNVIPAIYTLYAHLARIDDSIREGSSVSHGQTIGIMGRSATYTIPRSRAHLHFEMGLRMTDNFQSWYNRKEFGSANDHGVYNGMNLIGFDPLDFYEQYREGEVVNIEDYLADLPIVATVQIATMRRPDFLERYPSLVKLHAPMLIKGWEIGFTWNGLPVTWMALDAEAVAGMRPDEVKVIQANESLDRADRSRRLVVTRRGKLVPADDLDRVLELIFGLN